MLENANQLEITSGYTKRMSKKVEIKGLTLYPHQKPVFQDLVSDGFSSQMTYVIKSQRQVGKSILLSQLLLYAALNHPNSISILISITLAQTRKIFHELLRGIRDTGVVEKANESLLEMSFINGSQIFFKSAEQKNNLRGYSVRNGGICVADESAYFDDDVFQLILPWVNVSKAPLILASSPRTKSGFFYEQYILGMSGNPLVKSYDWSQYDLSAFLSPEKKELLKKTLPPSQYLTEVEGCFVDELGMVFQMNLINWRKRNEPPRPYNSIYLGVDFGTGNNNDFTVISGFSEHGEQVVLEMTNNMDPVNQVEWIANKVESLDMKKIRSFICEKNSLGSVYISMLRKRLPKLRIEEFVTSNENKRTIIELMVRDIGNNDVTLIDDDEQRKQFASYEMQVTSTGKITYNGIAGVHDDCVMSAAIARQKINNTNNYTLSFGRR